MSFNLPRVAVAILFAMFASIAICLFIAPYTVPYGSVRNLDANANMMDHQELWEEMPLFPKLVYWFGDFNCHQIEDRTFILNGNEMPVCARDTGIFLGNALGAGFVLTIESSPFVSVTMIRILPGKMQRPLLSNAVYKWGFIAFVAMVFLVPMAVDGTYQMFSQVSSTLPDYESTNPVRVMTGLLFGLFGGYFVAAMVASLFQVVETVPKKLK